MSLAVKARRAPGRISAGTFVLAAGVQKLSGDANTAKAIHGMAANAYPVLGKIPPVLFLKLLALVEIGVGSVLLLPIFGARLAGLALTGFSGGLLGMYFRTPEMHDKHGLPTLAGTAVAKDVWLNAIGTSLVLDSTLSR
ncbi:MAG: hypothetical protein ABI140_18190 [Jatrophihabitantaceae bacterium]